MDLSRHSNPREGLPKMKLRKKYLVYRREGDGEWDLVGVFSSGKKARRAITADCRRLVEVPLIGRPPCVPFVERWGAGLRLVHAAGQEFVYRVETLCEDAEIIK